MEHELRISDLGEAAALLTFDFELITLEQSPRGIYKLFVFQDKDDGAKNILSQYRNHKLNVDAYKFFMHTKELKRRVH